MVDFIKVAKRTVANAMMNGNPITVEVKYKPTSIGVEQSGIVVNGTADTVLWEDVLTEQKKVIESVLFQQNILVIVRYNNRYVEEIATGGFRITGLRFAIMWEDIAGLKVHKHGHRIGNSQRSRN